MSYGEVIISKGKGQVIGSSIWARECPFITIWALDIWDRLDNYGNESF